MIRGEDIVGEEGAEWYRLTPKERFRETSKAPERPVVEAALKGDRDELSRALKSEEEEARERDRLYWDPLKPEPEQFRHPVKRVSEPRP